MRALALVGVLAASAPAFADAPPKPENRRLIAVLEVHADGMPAEIANQFQNSLEQQLDSNRYWLVPRAKVKERMSASTRWTDGCVVGKCLSDVKAQTNADLVLLATLSGAGTSFGYVVTLVRTDVGEVVAQQGDRCDVCTLNEAMTNATLATIQLINAAPDVLPDREAEQRARTLALRAPLDREIEHAATVKRRVGFALALIGLAVGGVGTGLYFNHKQAGYGAIAAGGAGLLVGGATVLTF